ncbi:MAG: polysaccharide deacetylase family protein [Pseudonocardia sp.]
MRDVERRDHLAGTWLAMLTIGLVAPLAPVTSAPATPPSATVAPAPVYLPDAPVTARAVVLNVTPHVPPGGRTVALTFDDGPDPRWTPQVLELLARHRAVATFCLVGDVARGREQLVRQIAAAGMRLCDHSRTHDLELPGRAGPQLAEEIVDVKSQLAATSGAPIEYFRAPGGNWSPEIIRLAVAHGMQPLGWSVDTYDWRRPGADAIVATVRQQVRPGAVVLLHDGGGDRAQTVAALERLLPWLVEQGYLFTFP